MKVKSKSLFTCTRKSSYVRDTRQVNELPSLDTRYFRRLYKRKGKDGFVDVVNNFTQIAK